MALILVGFIFCRRRGRRAHAGGSPHIFRPQLAPARRGPDHHAHRPGTQVAVVVTFTATLLLPVAAAVGIGVALTLLQQLNRDAMDLTVVELIPLDDGRLAETEPPRQLPSERVTIVDVYGSLLYAGSRTLQVLLPEPAEHAVLVLRLRGRTSLGATFLKVICDYADRLAATGATPVLGESTYAAYLDAATWLTERISRESEDGDRVDWRSGPVGEPERSDDAQE